ncbi:unnamed protein product [Caenorhabditis sp. 36 PRJEB53466]|nr:unnamed protein product [Caenorhabditis sp. 36 PRJEB53466]
MTDKTLRLCETLLIDRFLIAFLSRIKDRIKNVACRKLKSKIHSNIVFFSLCHFQCSSELINRAQCERSILQTSWAFILSFIHWLHLPGYDNLKYAFTNLPATTTRKTDVMKIL